MTPKLIDIHCHLDFPNFEKDRKEVIKRTLDAGVWFINVGVNLETSKKSIELAEEYDGIWASVGLHPHDADKGFDFNQFRKLATHPKVVAIGECGLDNVRSPTPVGLQKEIFKRQIELALEVDKPLMIHCREAHNELLDILSNYQTPASKLRGDIHFFSGSLKEAEKYLALGFSLSFDGPITFSSEYDAVIKNMPFDKMMVETDSPFAAPAPYRGSRNEPLYVREVVKKIAQLKEVSFEDAARRIVKNAIDFFKLK